MKISLAPSSILISLLNLPRRISVLCCVGLVGGSLSVSVHSHKLFVGGGHRGPGKPTTTHTATNTSLGLITSHQPSRHRQPPTIRRLIYDLSSTSKTKSSTFFTLFFLQEYRHYAWARKVWENRRWREGCTWLQPGHPWQGSSVAAPSVCLKFFNRSWMIYFAERWVVYSFIVRIVTIVMRSSRLTSHVPKSQHMS
jgi:hypothetical protein